MLPWNRFMVASMIGKTFAGYKGGLLGPSGCTISYAGTGSWHFRANKKDYFLAAFDITPLFDPERVTPALVGLTASCNPVTACVAGVASNFSYGYLGGS